MFRVGGGKTGESAIPVHQSVVAVKYSIDRYNTAQSTHKYFDSAQSLLRLMRAQKK